MSATRSIEARATGGGEREREKVRGGEWERIYHFFHTVPDRSALVLPEVRRRSLKKKARSRTEEHDNDTITLMSVTVLL